MNRANRQNHVMHSAFAAISVERNPLVEIIIRSLLRNKPSTFGGWRVINRRGSNVKRRKQGSVS